MVQPLWETVRRFLRKLRVDLAISHLGIQPKETRPLSQRVTCAFAFTAALFTTAKAQK